MKRVLLLHPRPTRGGFTAVVEESRQLLESGFDVSVAVAPGAREDELPDGVQILYLPDSFRRLAHVRRLRAIVREQNPDIIHWHGRKLGFIGRIFCNRMKQSTVLYTPHGTPWAGNSLLRHLLNEVSERALLSRVDAVLCVSRAEQYDWIRRSSADMIRYMPNAIGPSKHSCIEIKSQFEDCILVPSGYHPQKRLEIVIDALAAVRDFEAPIPTVFCGPIDDVAYFEEIQDYAQRLGVSDFATFLDKVDDIEGAMASARIVVLPSYSEGLPIVGQEALSVGARIAWSAIPPHFELFANFGTPFWEKHELAEIMTSSERIPRPRSRQQWLDQFQTANRNRWTDFLDGLRGSSD